MSTNFSDLITYFESIATNHKSIGHKASEKHFFRMEIDEVLAGINRSDVNYPLLILEGYSFSFTDNHSDNLLKNRSGAFILLDHLSDQSDMDTMHEKWDQLEEIGTEILVKIKSDKRSREIPVVRNFQFNNVEGQLIRNSIGNDIGIRFNYTVTSPTPNTIDTDNWT
jgi:hypothetical protein